MTRNRKGYTLIEVLVVGIIISVLASVALVNYGVVVERARAKEGEQLLYALLASQKRYKLEHGAYAIDSPATDIDFVTINGIASNNFPSQPVWSFQALPNDTSIAVFLARRPGPDDVSVNYAYTSYGSTGSLYVLGIFDFGVGNTQGAVPHKVQIKCFDQNGICSKIGY